MSEDNEPDWLAELAKGGEALRRQIEPIVQAAEQFVRDSRQAKTTGGPALRFARGPRSPSTLACANSCQHAWTPSSTPRRLKPR